MKIKMETNNNILYDDDPDCIGWEVSTDIFNTLNVLFTDEFDSIFWTCDHKLLPKINEFLAEHNIEFTEELTYNELPYNIKAEFKLRFM